MKTYTWQTYQDLIESDVSAALKPDGSRLHGGGEVVICCGLIQSGDNRRCDDDSVLREDGSASYAVRGGGG